MTRSVFILLTVFVFITAGISQDTLFLKPGPDKGKDARITQTDAGTGGSPQIQCGRWTYDGIPATDRSVFEFDLSLVPEGAELINATLNLYVHPYGHSKLSGSNESMLYRVTEDWTEEDVNWMNQPAYTTENGINLRESEYDYQDYTNIDVTALVSDMLADPSGNYGFFLKMVTEEYYRRLCFASSDHPEAEKWPSLEIVYETCEPPQAVFDYSIDDSTVSFNSQDTSITEWLWDFGDGFLSTLQDPNHTFEDYGTYYVCLSATNECGTSLYCDSVTLCKECSSLFEFEINEMEVTFSNLSMNWDDFIWDFGNGFSSIVENPVYTFNIPGDHMVCLTVWNSCSENTFCDTVSVFSSQGINDQGNNGNNIAYPNPFNENLSVFLSGREINKISIADLTGKTLLHESIDAHNKVTLQTGSIPPGLYILTVRSEDRVYRQKIVRGIN